MRIFIAVEIPEAIKEKISYIEQELKGEVEKIKWVNPELVHFTLKFLGEISEEGLRKVKEITLQIARKYSPFTLNIEGMGVFPGYSSPRVIWIGVDEGKEMIGKLAEKLDKELGKVGFVREKREWVPHLTVGRVKFLREKEKLKELIYSREKIEVGKMKVENLSIIQSHLSPKGPIYKTIEKFSFAPES